MGDILGVMKQIDILAQTKQDLYDDAKIFIYIAQDMRRKLVESSISIHRITDKKVLEKTIKFAEVELQEIQRAVVQFQQSIRHTTETTLSEIYTQKQHLTQSLHHIAGLIGQTITMSHWQSPAINSAIVDNAGSQKGKILAHFNVYTRDMQVMGVEYEKAYRDQYISIPHTIPVFTFATSSGMAAMTTAALFIQGEASHERNILVASSCYFETKQLLQKLFGERVREVDLSDTKLAYEACDRFKPVAIFADTIGNEPSMRVIEISELIKVASSTLHERVFIVCDPSANTLNATYIDGFALPKNVALIGVESQNKLLQFGLDRVCAGIVWGTGYISQKLYDYRDHAGTICPDSTIATLPTPNRAMAKLYTKRLIRNTTLLVSILEKNPKIRAQKIHLIYPKNAQGVYFILHWKQSLLHSYNRYIHQVLISAKKLHISLVHGTSFGLGTTRIYTVAMHTQYTRPFLRIALGSETVAQVLALGDLFTKNL